jgi:hypothetical protein
MQIGSTGAASANPTDVSVSVLKKQQDLTKQVGAELDSLIDEAQPSPQQSSPGSSGSSISVYA